mmetsp:Transcript_29272/g.44289  ORF Transcript_29272/g.44289 Transcript_29272/m.44289 type:complete len:480 (-) Transcript_29272:1012-2451(-)
MSVSVVNDREQENEVATVGSRNPLSEGSSIGGVVFNFTNSIIGAGAIGLGGAFAASGGIVSIVCLLSFALLTKISLDMVIDLSMGSSYEQLGYSCYGRIGWTAVLVSKMLYSFGCLVAYIVVVKDNFASAFGQLFFHQELNPVVTTIFLSVSVVLPLCLLRDMTPLSKFSLFSVGSMAMIVVIVIYLFFYYPSIHENSGTAYENWFEIRPGLLESLGTFVFSFVSQHTVHLAFESLKPELRTLNNWKRISFWSLVLSAFISSSVGLVVYMTFWQHTTSDLFNLYPLIPVINIAKLLLCVTMLLTFPFPFFTCRDMIIVAAIAVASSKVEANEEAHSQLSTDLEVSLLPTRDEDALPDNETQTKSQSLIADDELSYHPSWLLTSGGRQLILSYHVAVTLTLWAITTTLALLTPNLGDVLDLVGCATGTILAFVLPSLFFAQKKGYFSFTAILLLIVGGIVGIVGTVFSSKQLWVDTKSVG